MPEVLPWTDERARETYFDFTQTCARHIEDHPGTAPYIARCGETAVRLATIRAAGRHGHGGQVDAGDMEWGAGIAWVCGQSLAEAALDYMPSNERREWADKFVSLIARRGPMKIRDIQQHIRSALRSSEIKNILTEQVEAGILKWAAEGYQKV